MNSINNIFRYFLLEFWRNLSEAFLYLCLNPFGTGILLIVLMIKKPITIFPIIIFFILSLINNKFEDERYKMVIIKKEVRGKEIQVVKRFCKYTGYRK